jgi:HD-GYP domain-containing protein (c-di-GMP phosphodiesterase class II)/DNA-binding CsgD family transcriptional regulator
VTARIRLAELLEAFSFASDLGRGQPMGHVLRTCRIAMALADTLKLPERDLPDIYFTSLLVHAGCTAGASEFAAFLAGDELKAQKDLCLCDPANFLDVLSCLRRNVAPGKPLPKRLARMLQVMAQGDSTFNDIFAGSSEVGARIAARMGMSEQTCSSLYNICETWNGKGPHRLKGGAIPLPSRLVNAAMVIEVFHSEHGVEAVKAAALSRKDRLFDPDIVAAIVKLCDDEPFWRKLNEEESWDTVLALEPLPHRYVDDASLDALLLSFADLADLKTSNLVARSRRTSTLAAAVAARLRLGEQEQVVVRRAALVQDVGLVTVPSLLLSPGRRLTAAETERVRLHPYYTERVLSRSSTLEPIGRIAAIHHERLDGSGYHKGLQGSQIPMTARILMTVDAYLELVDDGNSTTSSDQAIQKLANESRKTLDADCLRALADEVGGSAHLPRPQPKRFLPSGLTERELEVLGLISRGYSVKECAEQLVLSNHTVRHHLENIYGKTGVTSRAGAVLYAVDNNLIG